MGADPLTQHRSQAPPVAGAPCGAGPGCRPQCLRKDLAAAPPDGAQAGGSAWWRQGSLGFPEATMWDRSTPKR